MAKNEKKKMNYQEAAQIDIELNELDKSSLLDLMAECKTNSALLGKVLYPHIFTSQFTQAHLQVFDLIDNCKSKKKAVSAPRGWGKSSIAELVCSKDILFGDKHFIGYLSDSTTKAEMSTESIKTNVTTNENVTVLFPPVTTIYNPSADTQFSKKAWVAYGQTFILPRGAGQQVNGLKWGHYRPDRWIPDDLENIVEIRNETQRRKLREWFYGPLMNTRNMYEENCEFFYIDTIKHEDALLAHILRDPDWECIRLSVCDDNFKTLMPEFMSQEKLDALIFSHKEKKIMDIFAREFMSLPSSPDNQSFADLFQYYNETDEDFVKRLSFLINILIIDPAKTDNMANAQSGFVVWGIDFERRKYHVRQAFGDFLNANDVCATGLRLADQYNVDAIGMEITGLESWGSYTFKNMMHGRGGKIYHFEELKAKSGHGDFSGEDGSKIGRVELGLLPLYEQGLVYHNRVGCGALEAQELSYPHPEKWDVIDAAAYLPAMLERVLMYIDPDGSVGYEEDPALIEDREYSSIQNEPPIKRWGVGYNDL